MKNWKNKLMSPSRIDSYLYYKNSEQTLDEFIDNLLGLTTMSVNVYAGIAVHSFIEKCGCGEFSRRVNNKFNFLFRADKWRCLIKTDKDITITLPGRREEWINKQFGDVLISGRVDARGNYVIHDLKTTSDCNLERYMASMQWKMYLWMTGCKQFVYDIIEVKIYEDKRIILIKDYIKLKLYSYVGMEEEIIDTLTEYSLFLDSIKDKIRDKVAA